MLRAVAQKALPATTLVDLYTAQHQSTGAITLKSLLVCNRSASSATFRLSLALGGEPDDNKQYLFYNLPLVPNDSFTSALDIGMAAGDVIRAYASNANVSITLFGI